MIHVYTHTHTHPNHRCHRNEKQLNLIKNQKGNGILSEMKKTPQFCLSIPWNLENFWKMRLNVYAGFSLPFGIIFCSALTGGFEPSQQWGIFVPAEEPRRRGLVCLGLRVHTWLKGSLSEAVAGGDGPGGWSPLTYILAEVLKLISWEAPCWEGHEQMPTRPEFPPASQFSTMLGPRGHTGPTFKSISNW